MVLPEDDMELKDAPRFKYSEALERLMRPTVYAIFKNDEILYVGSTGDLRQRLRQHAQDILQTEGAKISWIHVSDKAEEMAVAHIAEKNFIRKYQPPLNIADRGTDTLTERRRRFLKQQENNDLDTWLKKHGKGSLQNY